MYSQDKVHLQAELDALLKGVWHDRLQPKALILNYLVMGFYKMQDYLAMVMIFKLQPIQTIIWQK